MFDPNTQIELPVFTPNPKILEVLEFYKFEDYAGKTIAWSLGQIEIIECIFYRSAPDAKKRIQIIASTQYGKSLAVAAGVCTPRDGLLLPVLLKKLVLLWTM